MSHTRSELDLMSYAQRLEKEKESGWWKQDDLIELPAIVKRCTNWDQVEAALDDIESDERGEWM